MLRIGIREMRDRFSSLIDRVRNGEQIVLTDRGKDVAVIRPVRPAESLQAWLEKLETEGVIVSAAGWEPLDSREPVRLKGKPLSEMVVEERRSGR